MISLNSGFFTGKKSALPQLIRTLLISIVMLLFTASLPALSKSTLGISQKVYEMLQTAQTQIGEKNYSAAKTQLEAVLALKRLNNYEKAQTLSVYGNMYFQMDKLDQALATFKQVVEFDDLPQGFLHLSLRTVAQLALMQDQNQDALLYAKRLLALSPTADSHSHILIAQIYYRMENYPQAKEHALTAIESERKLGNPIRENWLLVLNSIYYSLEDYAGMEVVLKELIALYPKERYIKNLAAIYGQSGKTEKQLLLLEPLYEQNRLTQETELLNLAQLLLLHEVPWKAAKLLEKAMAEKKIARTQHNLEMSAQAWQMAAEDSRSLAYLIEAAKTDEDGSILLRLAQTWMSLYRWDEAEKTLTQVVKKKSLENPGNALVLLGMARFYQNNYSGAQESLQRAAGFEASKKLAEQWLAYIDQEVAKLEAAKP